MIDKTGNISKFRDLASDYTLIQWRTLHPAAPPAAAPRPPSPFCLAPTLFQTARDRERVKVRVRVGEEAGKSDENECVMWASRINLEIWESAAPPNLKGDETFSEYLTLRRRRLKEGKETICFASVDNTQSVTTPVSTDHPASLLPQPVDSSEPFPPSCEVCRK